MRFPDLFMAQVFTFVLAAFLLFAGPAQAQAVGENAPDFEALSVKGETVRLSDFHGRIVVLEWTSHSCPYTGKQYLTGQMQALQSEAGDAGVVWLSIISEGAAGAAAGSLRLDRIAALEAARGSEATLSLADENANAAKLYRVTSTPTMAIIDEAGTLRYFGAIDDQRTVRPSSVKIAHNYVEAALADLGANRPVAISRTRPYGCAIRY